MDDDAPQDSTSAAPMPGPNEFSADQEKAMRQSMQRTRQQWQDRQDARLATQNSAFRNRLSQDRNNDPNRAP